MRKLILILLAGLAPVPVAAQLQSGFKEKYEQLATAGLEKLTDWWYGKTEEEKQDILGKAVAGTALAAGLETARRIMRKTPAKAEQPSTPTGHITPGQFLSYGSHNNYGSHLPSAPHFGGHSGETFFGSSSSSSTAPQSPVTRTGAHTLERLQELQPQFDAFATSAVLDAETYQSCIEPEVLQEVLDRARQVVYSPTVTQARSRSQQQANVIAQLNPVEDAPQIQRMMKQVAKDVKAGKAGVCTTFAMAAADIVTDSGNDDSVRVEVMARRRPDAALSTHLFAVVGRPEGSDINDRTTWRNTRIVDLWLRALGNQSVYTVNEFKNFLEGAELSVVYDNWAAKQA